MCPDPWWYCLRPDHFHDPYLSVLPVHIFLRVTPRQDSSGNSMSGNSSRTTSFETPVTRYRQVVLWVITDTRTNLLRPEPLPRSFHTPDGVLKSPSPVSVVLSVHSHSRDGTRVLRPSRLSSSLSSSRPPPRLRRLGSSTGVRSAEPVFPHHHPNFDTQDLSTTPSLPLLGRHRTDLLCVKSPTLVTP